jgi:hypothetical protein
VSAEEELAAFRHEAGEQWAKEYAAARSAEAKLATARAMLADAVEGWEKEAASTDGGLVDGLYQAAADVRAVLDGPLAAGPLDLNPLGDRLLAHGFDRDDVEVALQDVAAFLGVEEES